MHLHLPEKKSTSGSAPETKGSRLLERTHHTFLYPLLAGYQPSRGLATQLFHLVGQGVGPSSQWQIICGKASFHVSYTKAMGTCALYIAKKVIMEILGNFKF